LRLGPWFRNFDLGYDKTAPQRALGEYPRRTRMRRPQTVLAAAR
jgi:hypothetical protein